MKSRIYAFIYVLASSLLALPVSAQEEQIKEAIEKEILIKDSAPVFGGVAVSADLCGLFMKVMNAKFANMEAACRLNFKEKYFPIGELGIGDCTKNGAENNNRFSTTAPYIRVGMDYNLNKKMNGNRFFCGLRYAFSSFKFDYDNPDFTDEYWSEQHPLSIHGQKDNTQWLEFVIGVETKLWSIVRLGWNIRYKNRLHQSGIEYGEPWFVPGFGRNGGTVWGGNVNLTFDVGKTAKKNIK